MINYCRIQLLQKKQSITNDLKSTKRSLLQKVNVNPKCWNIDSLKVSLDASNPIGIASLLKMNITLIERSDVQQQVERDQKLAQDLMKADMLARKTHENESRNRNVRIERRKRRELNLLANLDSSESD